MSQTMRLVPFTDRVIIRPLEESVSRGGIHLPDVAKEKPRRGTVVAVGPGKMMEDRSAGPMFVKKGQTVYFTRYAGNEIELEGEKYLIVGQDDLLAGEE